MNYVVKNCAIQHDAITYGPGPLPADHKIPKARLASFVAAGMLEEVAAPKAPVAPKPKPPAPPKSKWSFDPEGIRGTPVERLNARIKALDPEAPAFETTEEAVAFLSQDFVIPG